MASSYTDLRAEADRRRKERDSLPVVRVSVNMASRAVGAEETLAAAEAEVRRRGLQAEVLAVGNLGLTWAEPLMDVTLPGGPRIFYAGVTPDKARAIIESHVGKGQPPVDIALGGIGKDLPPGLADLSQHPFMRLQKRIALKNAGTVVPGDVLDYVASGGYEALNKAITGMDPDKVREEVVKANVRGRGGAGFPAGVKWNFLARSPGPVKYILANCEEGDPGSFNDQGILDSDPLTLIEGATLAGFATGATYGYVFIRQGHVGPIERTWRAIEEARKYGLLGKNILGSNFSFDMEVSLTGDSYVAGEETAMMEAMEGKRAMPRYKPPFPAQAGLFNKPTNINNVKTLSYMPEVIRNGGEWFAAIGTEKSKGTALICLSGHIKRPGLVEVPLGLTLRQVVEEIGGGVPDGQRLKLLQTGGPLGGVLSAEKLDLLLDFDAMGAAGAILGSGGIVACNEDTCVVDLVRELVTFCQFESCGKCFPCRMGMSHLLEIMQRITSFMGTSEDIVLLKRVGQNMQAGSLCGHGQLGFNPVSSALRYFASEFDEHIKQKRCPTGKCHERHITPVWTRRDVPVMPPRVTAR